MSLKATIAAAQDIPSKVVTVDEWDGVRLLLKAFNGEDYIWFIKTASKHGTGAETDMVDFALTYASEMIQRGAWDPDNPTERVFAREDIAGILDAKSFNVRQQLALELAMLTTPTQDEVSAEKKDSSAGETAGSASS